MAGETQATASMGRWLVLWDAFFYVVLAYATFNAAYYGSPGARTVALLPLVAALGLWHTYWIVRRADRGRRTLYVVVAGVLWLALLALDPDFLVVGVAIFAPLCLHDVRWGVIGTSVAGGGWIWQRWVTQGAVPWVEIIGVALLMLAGLLSVGYVATVVRQSRERQRLLDELHRTQAELAEAERHAGILDERQRLSRDIHDTLTQGFAIIVMFLEATDASLVRDDPARRHVARALRSARASLRESRRVVRALRPEVLEEATLPVAASRTVEQLADESGILADFVVTGTVVPLQPARETALLRVLQEALANVRRHARATAVTVTLSYMDGLVVLDVQDDGVGFAPARGTTQAVPSGVGLQSMRERVEDLDGTVVVESTPGAGTTVVVQIPAADRGSVEAAPLWRS